MVLCAQGRDGGRVDDEDDFHLVKITVVMTFAHDDHHLDNLQWR